MNNLTFGAHLHGVELIMSHSIALWRKTKIERKNSAATATSSTSTSTTKKENKRAIGRMLHLLQFRAFVFTFHCVCFGRSYPHIGPRSILFCFCAWFVKMFYFYLKWKFDKETALQVEHANKYSVSFFRVPFFRLLTVAVLHFSPKIWVALRSPLYALREAHHKAEICFYSKFLMRLCIDDQKNNSS